MREIVEVLQRLTNLERQVANQFRHGTVHEVDATKQKVRMNIGGSDQEPLLGPWIPYGQIAGGLKVHTPPTVGQQMTMLSPSGDYRQAVALPMTWSDHNASPSQKRRRECHHLWRRQDHARWEQAPDREGRRDGEDHRIERRNHRD